MPQSIFVLVHGLWHGGWCWSRVADILRTRGHQVHTPTNTGVGDRSHLINAEITLETFARDIEQHILFEDLHDLVLVGHSFGGATICGTGDKVAERISKVIYLDAAILQPGESWFDLLDSEIAQARQDLANQFSNGLSLPPVDPEILGVTKAADIAFLKPRLTPHPLATLKTSLAMQKPAGKGLNPHYIHLSDPPYMPANGSLDRARQYGWPISEIAACHEAIVTAPLAVADELERIANEK
ncbi:alpha/beta hydrolase family protein [Ruegeria atlantica]|uniref:alpha/beta hydrolase family protein n=1 Tax=Ruegeria atlantica TaxID=81569 RepID=UPI002494E33D|nr:alpha/beta hydrolase family protein [Ruegeria atlantica]